LGSGVVTLTDISSRDILAQDFQIQEIMPCQEIQIQEGLNLMDKQEGTGIISNNSIEVSPGYCSLIVSCPSYIYVSPTP